LASSLINSIILTMFSNIIKAARAVGSDFLPNDAFIEKYKVDSTNEWIENMTGIKQRYFAESVNELESMATSCAKEVASDIDFAESDGVIVASSTNSYRFPGISQFVHKNLGLKESARALDVNAACNGFMQALEIADFWIKGGLNNIIVIGAEIMSSVLNMKDRNTCCLFGDGAGAVLLSKDENHGIRAFENKVLSKRWDTLVAKEYIEMNGRAVFENSVKAFEEVILNVLEKAGVSLQSIDYFVLHQANKRIFQALAKKMNINEEKLPFPGAEFANTSAATIPMTLSTIDFKNKSIVLAGFGAGFTTTASVIV